MTPQRENNSPIGPLEKHYYDQSEVHARKTLDAVAFESAFAKEEKMSFDEALDLVLKTMYEEFA